ncbi:MAG: hypothetical protein EOM23_08180, partial [Candidatus Moranbacteria bacterium]|nr:hypothetical protein [Candidatus Moranbacteria bacterium]
MRNETFFKRQWKIAVMALLFIVLVASILYTTIPTIAYAKEVDFAENTIQRRIPTLNDDFDDSKVIVVLNQKNSKYNGVVRIEDFKIDVEKASLVNTQQTERLDRGDDSVTDAVKTGQAVVTDLFRVDNAKSSSLVRESEFFQILSIDLPIRGKEKVLEAIAELEKSEIVYSAEPDYRYETIDLWVPNDTNYATNQWGLTGTNGIQAANTWDMTRGLADIRVGLFETGAQQNHPDLNGRFLAPNFTLGNADHGT